MCGLAGLIAGAAVDRDTLARMTGTLHHRGPDDGDLWIDPEARIGLGHRRLAIVDLSPHGRQPMHSTDGRLVLAFNGEIYNHLEIRSLLEQEGQAPQGGWRGHSDTETLVEAIAALGLDRTLALAVGMFAFALWDRRDRRLQLVRDRFGEKPLYYGWAGRDFLFGSELKALRVHPAFDTTIDRRALRDFISRTYVPAPRSIYRGIFKLEPGCILDVSPDAARSRRDEPPREGSPADGLALRRYWSYRDVMREGAADPFDDEEEALAALDDALSRSVRGQSVADVPVGAFLSGGIDSSTVTAIYQRESPQTVRTYSIGFEEAGYNEAEDARRVAEHLGTIHHEHYVTVDEARDVILLLPAMYDEPFADSSQIPTFLVSRFARRDVTVALTGDGGDELFAGYNRHFAAPTLWGHLQRVPGPLRSLAGSVLGRLPSSFWSTASSVLPGDRQPHFGGKMQKALRLAASARHFDDVYTSFLDEWSFERSPVIGGEGGGAGFDLSLGGDAPDALRMMYCDALSYLPDDILCKVDRASMAVSLETRVPFLDHRLAAVAARIPLSMKVRDGKGKHILRRLLHRHVPPALVERPKAGFGIPVGEWVKGPLRPWAEELLDPASLAADGLLDPMIVRRRWEDHLSGRRDSAPAIWALLMFQAWRREQRETLAAAA